MPGSSFRYSATYESPYLDESAAAASEKPVVTIRGYDDRENTAARPICLTEDYGSAGGSSCLLDDGGGGGCDGESGDGGEESPPAPLIKTLATPASKPLPIDPLQFVKTPVPPLCKQAVEQIQLATENKITKEKVKEEEEEWQANLDKWKSARRQRVPERLLSRAEEAKKLLEEEEQRQIRKVKTFSEMMQQRQHRQQSRYSLNFYQDMDENFDEENKENDAQRTARLTTADSVDSQSEGKSSDGASSEERLTESESHGSEERLASPVEVWTADSGVDSFSGSNQIELAITTSTDLLKEFSSPSECQPIPRDEPSNPNEVIIRLSINPSSDIFGFTLMQDGQKVVVESVDEDGVADLAGLKKHDEIISLNGVLADSPGSVPSSMDLALMTGQLEMVIYRADASGRNADAEEAERMSEFQRKLARFSGDVDVGTIGDRSAANEVIIEPKLVERRKSQLFIQALQMEQQENEEKEKLQDLVPVEDQLVLKRKNSLSKSMNENRYETADKKAPLDEIEPQIIERKKAEFIRQASIDNITRSELRAEIAVEPHIVLQRKASIENCAQRQEDVRVLDLQPSVPVAQLKASIESSGNSSEPNKPKTPSVDIELTIEERKASFFEHSGKDVEKTTVDVPIEPKLIEQRKASFIENRNDSSQKASKAHLELDIQPRLLEQRKADFLENAAKTAVKTPQDEAICVEKYRLPLQNSSGAPLARSDSGRKVELIVNNMQSKPKCEVPIEPDLIRKRKEALFCSSSMTNEIERRRVKLANIEAEVYGEIRGFDPSPPASVVEELSADRKPPKATQVDIGQSAMSPAGCSETSEDSRSLSSSTTTVTEIRREVGNIMLSSVASGSLFSPVSDRNESPAHLSDVSPEEICSPRSKSSLFESARDEPLDYGFLKQLTPAGAVPERRDLSDIVLDSPTSEGEQNVRSTLVADRNRTCVKDAGHTPWVRENSRRDELPARQQVPVTSKSLEPRPNQLNFMRQEDDSQKCEVVNSKSTPQTQHPGPAPTRISIDVENNAYENHEVGAGERMNQVPPMYDIYDQLPGQPPRGHKKGVPPPPPSGVVPYGEELYENAPQFKTQQYHQGGLQPTWKEPMNPRSVGSTHVQQATNVQTSHHTQPPSHTRDDDLYGELRKTASDSINQVEVRKRENQIRRQERKSYHEGIVNYPAYDYLGQPNLYNCPEDIYENTRKYASKSCEDVSDVNSQYQGRTMSQFMPSKDLSVGRPGYGHDIYENVEAYAKNTDYRNNLHKPSVTEDFYEVPRRSEQSKVKFPVSQSSGHDQMQRSRSQPYVGTPVGSSDPKLRPQRSSAENLDEPRPLTAEIGAKRKPALTNKPFNANHWLIQEAEMRRQLEANIYASAVPQIQSGGNAGHCGTAPSIPASQANITNVSLNVSEASPQVPPMRKTVPPNTAPFQGNQSGQPLAISGKKRCSLCTSELGRGAAMVIESLQLHFHLDCFRCCVCKQRLGNGTCGTDVRVRNSKLHCQNCYSNDEAGVKLSRV